jgi:Tol biopolymer transport system component
MLKTLFRVLLLLWGTFSLSLFISAFAPQTPILIYFTLAGQDSDIFAYDFGTDMRLNLSNSPYPEWRGSWSETGLLAFTADASVRESTVLFLTQDFAPPQRLESLYEQFIFGASLAPNGKNLLYISSEPVNYSEIYLVDLLSGEQINLSQTASLSESEPQWLGNEQVIFLLDGNLYMQELASHHPKMLIDGSFIIEKVLLSPDRQSFAFHGLETNERRLYIAQTDGSHLLQIALPQSLSNEPLSWSPDSQALAFTLQDGSLNIYQIASQELLLFPSPARRSNPLWSPDGMSIAFMENRRLNLLQWQTGAILTLEEEELIRPPLLWMPQ